MGGRFAVESVAGMAWNTQTGERNHLGSTVGMDGEGAGNDPLALDALGDQLAPQRRGGRLGDEPAHDVATEQVEQHVEIEILCTSSDLI